MSVLALRPLLAALIGAACAFTACAEALPACPVDAFADKSAAQRESLLARPCGGEHFRWQVNAPRGQPAQAGASLINARVETVASERFASLLGTVKFGWAGNHLRDTGRLRTERAALSAGGLLRLDRAWALQMELGREVTDTSRTRATVASIWRPVRHGLVFAEWAGSEEQTEAHRVGARLWLFARKLSLDVGARHLPGGAGWAERRIGLTLGLGL